MLNCEQVSQRVSESLERDLSLYERAGLWMHLLMCGICRRFRKNLIHLHDAVRESIDEHAEITETTARLSPAARERMKKQVRSLM